MRARRYERRKSAHFSNMWLAPAARAAGGPSQRNALSCHLDGTCGVGNEEIGPAAPSPQPIEPLTRQHHLGTAAALGIGAGAALSCAHSTSATGAHRRLRRRGRGMTAMSGAEGEKFCHAMGVDDRRHRPAVSIYKALRRQADNKGSAPWRACRYVSAEGGRYLEVIAGGSRPAAVADRRRHVAAGDSLSSRPTTPSPPAAPLAR